jgi:hypothetical protein
MGFKKDKNGNSNVIDELVYFNDTINNVLFVYPAFPIETYSNQYVWKFVCVDITFDLLKDYNIGCVVYSKYGIQIMKNRSNCIPFIITDEYKIAGKIEAIIRFRNFNKEIVADLIDGNVAIWNAGEGLFDIYAVKGLDGNQELSSIEYVTKYSLNITSLGDGFGITIKYNPQNILLDDILHKIKENLHNYHIRFLETTRNPFINPNIISDKKYLKPE